jgi:hypothetical protein
MVHLKILTVLSSLTRRMLQLVSEVGLKMYLTLQAVLEQLKEPEKDTGIILEELKKEISTSQDKLQDELKMDIFTGQELLRKDISARQEELK